MSRALKYQKIETAQELSKFITKIAPALAKKEEEDTWKAMDTGLLELLEHLKKDSIVTMPNFLVCLNKIKEGIANCIVSERSKLSGTACDVVAEFSTKVGRDQSALALNNSGIQKNVLDFDGLLDYFVSYLLKLCVRANRVNVQKSSLCMEIIIKNTGSPFLMGKFMEGLRSNSKGLRSCCIRFVNHVLTYNHAADLEVHKSSIEESIRLCLSDADVSARESAKIAFFSYQKHFPVEAEELKANLPANVAKYLKQSISAPVQDTKIEPRKKAEPKKEAPRANVVPKAASMLSLRNNQTTVSSASSRTASTALGKNNNSIAVKSEQKSLSVPKSKISDSIVSVVMESNKAQTRAKKLQEQKAEKLQEKSASTRIGTLFSSISGNSDILSKLRSKNSSSTSINAVKSPPAKENKPVVNMSMKIQQKIKKEDAQVKSRIPAIKKHFAAPDSKIPSRIKAVAKVPLKPTQEVSVPPVAVKEASPTKDLVDKDPEEEPEVDAPQEDYNPERETARDFIKTIVDEMCSTAVEIQRAKSKEFVKSLVETLLDETVELCDPEMMEPMYELLPVEYEVALEQEEEIDDPSDSNSVLCDVEEALALLECKSVYSTPISTPLKLKPLTPMEIDSPMNYREEGEVTFCQNDLEEGEIECYDESDYKKRLFDLEVLDENLITGPSLQD